MKNTRNNSIRNILLQCGLIFLIAFMILFSAANVSAQDTVMRRYGLYIGSNYGGRDRVTLSYAVTDARAISEVMQQLGGVMPTDSIILTDPSPYMVNHTISEIKKNIKSGDSKRAEFFFYYSGHSDEQGLLLGDSVYSYEDLKDVIDSVEADVNIAVLDSCSSGAFTRMKGGVRRSPFLSDESINASGHAFLTSSSEDEAAQESDDLGASFFTHYFVTALRGAADSTLDGTVSLNEAYSYASSETLARTEDTLAGPQHPSYDIQLAGTGDLVLTDLRSISESIMFEESLRGRIFVRDSAGRLVVELKKIEGTPLAVSIGPGRYSMILDDGNQLLSADLLLTGGSKVIVMKDEFYPVPRSANTVRGGTRVAVDDGRSLDKPAGAETQAGAIDDTATELDIIAERARKRALEAAGMSSGTENRTEYYETDNGEVKFTPSKYEKAVRDAAAEEAPESEQSPKQMPPGGDHGMSIGLIADADNFSGVQVGAIGANVNGMLNGIQIGGIYTSVSESATGLQLAGVYAATKGDIDGVQVSGVWNMAEGDVMGLQLSGVWNSAFDVAFAQVSGVFNIAEGQVMGAQVSGVFNIAEGQVMGAQASGIFNIAEDEVLGVQLAGILNSAGDVDGFQASGVINVAEDVKGGQLGLLNFGGVVSGLQIGLINISDELHGIPIGLINISGNGLHDLSVWYTDNGMINFGYQLGTSSVYTFMNAGFSENWSDSASLGIGMGLEIGDDSFFFDTDLYAKYFNTGSGSALDNMQSIFLGSADVFPAIRFSAGVELFDFISIFGGINFDCGFTVDVDGNSFEAGEVMASSYGVNPLVINYDYGEFKMYPSWFVGVRI